MALKALRIAYTFVWVIPLTVFLATFLLLLSPIDFVFRYLVYRGSRLGPVGTIVKLIWCQSVLKFHGVKLRVHNQRYLSQPAQGVIYVANHQSLLDIPIIFSCVSPHTVFLAKRELFWIPFFGFAAWLVGTQFINRSKGQSDPSLKRLSKNISDGLNVVIFPEGTRSDNGDLKAFKRGAFLLAIQTGAPIHPLAIRGSMNCLKKGGFEIQSGIVDVISGAQIDSREYSMSTRAQLSDRVQEQIRNQLDNLH